MRSQLILKKLFLLENRWVNHTLFWLFIITFFTLLPSLSYRYPFFWLLSYNMIFVPVDMAATYFTLYYLLPRYLIKGKPVLFFLGFLILSVLVFLYSLFVRYYLEPAWGFYFQHPHWLREYIDSVTMLFFIVGIATVIKFIRHYYLLQLEKLELEKINLQGELKVLKSQVTPHFLFNVLNNIDELVYQDPEKASNAIGRFSNLLRSMLGEMTHDLVPLAQEIQHIKDYVELMRLGFRSPEFIRFSVEGDPEGIMVAPMLFTPLVENTFKHSDKKSKSPGITFDFRIRKETVEFSTCNAKKTKPVTGTNSGTGLNNLKKRLNLTYPNKHILDIRDDRNHFNVLMIIPC